MYKLYHVTGDKCNLWVIATDLDMVHRKTERCLEKAGRPYPRDQFRIDPFVLAKQEATLTGYHRDGSKLVFTLSVESDDTDYDDVRFGDVVEVQETIL